MHAQAAGGLCFLYASKKRERSIVWIRSAKTFCAMSVRTHGACMSHALRRNQIGLQAVLQPIWQLEECPGNLITQLVHDQKGE